MLQSLVSGERLQEKSENCVWFESNGFLVSLLFTRLECENKQVLQYISTSLSIKQQVTQSELGYPQPYSDIWKFIITITSNNNQDSFQLCPHFHSEQVCLTHQFVDNHHCIPHLPPTLLATALKERMERKQHAPSGERSREGTRIDREATNTPLTK